MSRNLNVNVSLKNLIMYCLSVKFYDEQVAPLSGMKRNNF